MKNLYLVILMTLFLFTACELKQRPYGDEDHNARIEVLRYDRLESRYLTTSDFSALQRMNTEFPVETRTLLEKVLQIGEVNDPEISSKFLRFFQDSTLLTLISDTEAEYANMDDLNKGLNAAFDYLKEQIPGLSIPRVYAQIGALDQSIIIGDKSIGICLDKYMGENYPLYEKYYSYQQRESMTRSYIVPDCVTFYLLSLYPIQDFERRTQLEHDLHMAKVMWVTNQALKTPFFNTEYTRIIDNFMTLHKGLTVSELLALDDYSKIMP
ncbi:gliding motility protein GldB [Prevotella sp. oral taxon 376]|uniref:gliding motility protein GldB-related protein n=1 Tax=Prevotella sp. oral taxon 376 TaxID=712466 RepID=UPI000D1FCAA3|nr:gliding motility protein GldB [Prevotella sp. oral taxon 376]PTL32656.1 gliding motility protein GldB [Prevotella sp. oral taxon 376]